MLTPETAIALCQAARSTVAARYSPRRRAATLAALVGGIAAGVACTQAPAPAPRSSEALPKSAIRFTDVTKASRLRSTWVSGGTGHNYYVEQMGGGGAFLDYDGDGRLDIFTTGGGVLPRYTGPQPSGNRLYRNDPDGTFTDVTKEAGLETGRYTLGVATADYDNDGHPDLYITTAQGNVLYHNDGHGHFVDVTAKTGVGGGTLSTSAAFLDYDGDGWLDLFVARYMDYSIATDRGCLIRGMGQQDLNKMRILSAQRHSSTLPLMCGPHEMPTTASRLYRNSGHGTFTDVTAKSGIGEATAHALAIAIADFNEDGRPDIYVASDGFPNLLFMNHGNGTFTEDAARAGVAVGKNGAAFAGMGADAADYDNDGHFDILQSNYEKEPQSLYRGRGDGTFIDMTESSGLLAPSFPFLKWGCRLLDFNGDGRRDALVVNGHVDPAGTPGRPLNFPDDKWPGKGFAQEALVFAGTGDGRFADVSASAGRFFREKHAARGAAFADFDNDGDWDVLIVNIDEPAVLIRNDSRAFRWGRLELEGSGCNRDALGSLVRVTTGGVTQTEYVRSAGSYLSDHDHRPLFSLPGSGPATAEIRWPCGAVQTVTLTPGKTLHVTEAGCRLPPRKGSR